MKLKKLLKDLPISQVKGSKDIEITGICANSKLTAPGNLFVAKRGFQDDGNRYIPEAIAAGASAILTDIYDPSLKNITQVICPHVASIEGQLAAQYYQFPTDDLFMIGITGTNGKTTSSFLIKHLLDVCGERCGLSGTIECIIGEHRYKSTLTTPDVTSNHKRLREMVLHGCTAAVMEVTSHALSQNRVDGIEFDAALFTNLTQDHLDYHRTMDSYCEAKAKLFQALGKHPREKKKKMAKTAVINADSPWSKEILKNCTASILTYGILQPADLIAEKIVLTAQGTDFDLIWKGEEIPCSIPLIGRFNVYNCLGALAVGLTRGLPLDKMIAAVKTFHPTSGRLEPVINKLGLKIYVDFAHSDDALRNVLSCLQELKKGKLITVFGCGGDRDQTKRPKMAKAVEEYSDFSIVTSDNPRSEDPAAICKEIVTGFSSPERYMVEVDRRAAIKKAIDLAKPDDILLIAGKGHETVQIFAHKIIEFDDRKVAAQLCESKVKS